ncbi:VOC family protein [Nocardiopsis alba]|uniref:VOC family protein n=1 Tax=Nocardiopsis alba TaxID=53437 RepID=UPI0033A8C3AF
MRLPHVGGADGRIFRLLRRFEIGGVSSGLATSGHGTRLRQRHGVLEASPAVRGEHDRKRAGSNHLAFRVNTADEVESLVRKAAGQGWTLMFADRHPHAAGPDRHVAYLEDPDGFEVELVAMDKTAEP